jgi:membrane-associated phospholipid phosphatase
VTVDAAAGAAGDAEQQPYGSDVLPDVQPRPAVDPGRFARGETIARFDRWADVQLERLRGNPVADAVFVSASTLGDWSLIWHIVNVSRGLTSERRAQQSTVLALALGAESLLVNQGLKRLFRRPRPTVEGDPRYPVRRPLTSSFPSGHASAAAFTAVLLTSWDGRRSAPFWWTLASTVAVSRAYVRIHHASDVVAGMATGAVLGLGARAILRRTGIMTGLRRLTAP